MHITSREKAIIEQIIKTSGRHTAFSIASSLNVSARTIQRDLKSVEKIIRKFNLSLARNTNQGLVIEGENEQIYKLLKFLTNSGPIDEPTKEKKLRLLLAIMDEDMFKIQALSSHLGVSSMTLTMYLDELAAWLSKFNLHLTRKRGVGVELSGAEANKRRALAQYYLQTFHEELIEKIFLLEKGQLSENRILHYFNPDYLLEVNSLVNATFTGSHGFLSDSSYLEITLHICITMQRIEYHFFMEEDFHLTKREVTVEYQLMKTISQELEQNFGISFSKCDILYLALIQKGTKFSGTEAVSYDAIILAQKIKVIIQSVSDQLHVDLTKDFSLLQGLLAHMAPSLFRIQQEMEIFNPLKMEIKKKYPFLFLAVQKSVEEEFKEFDSFPEDEIAFIVMHFGSALVLQEENLSIQALVICPTGIGTSKMLASRIKKEIPGIDFVETKSIKDLSHQVNLHAYDIILSTVRLPFMMDEYILVNPLLSEENIMSIKSFLQKNIKSLTKGKQYQKVERRPFATLPTEHHMGLSVLLKDLKNVQQSIEDIIDNFRFYRMSNSTSHEQILKKMVMKAAKEKLLTNPKDVLHSLNEREKRGGLGIPDTNFALFHARNMYVRKLIFQIAHLPKPWVIKGMDGKDVVMKNLFLMLAPAELSVREQEIVSLISTSMIESHENILVFSSANEELIYMKLESIFIDYLQHNYRIINQ